MLADIAIEEEKHQKPNMTYRMIWLIAILVIIGIFVVAAILKSKSFIPQNSESSLPVQPVVPLGLSYTPEADIHLAGNEMLRTDGTHSIFQ
jgi:hypothetical protein